MSPQDADLLEELRHLRDREAIRDCCHRYARGVDRHDEELIKSAFWPDAQINYGTFSGTPDTFAPWANAYHAERFSAHVHNLTTQTIDIQGDTAHVETYVVYFLREKGTGQVRVGGGRYIERHERRGAEWRIAVREFLVDVGFYADVGQFPAAYLNNPLSRRDAGDLSYVRPLGRRPAPDRPLTNTEVQAGHNGR